MTQQVLRVYDSDFAEHEDALINAAVSAALDYQGNWESLVAMKRRVLRDVESIDAKTARQILNMALTADPTPDLIQTIIGLVGGRRNRMVSPSEVMEHIEPRPHLRIVKPVERRWTVRTPDEIKGMYGAGWARNCSLHVIDHDNCYVDWHAKRRNSWDYNRIDFEHRYPILTLHWVCDNGTQSHLLKAGLRHPRIFQSDNEAKAADLATCRSGCFEEVSL